MVDLIVVEVAFATPDKQMLIAVSLNVGSTAQQAIEASGIASEFTEIDLAQLSIGVFGKACRLDKVLEQNDRIEIYRSLLQDPMDARRNRAVATRSS